MKHDVELRTPTRIETFQDEPATRKWFEEFLDLSPGKILDGQLQQLSRLDFDKTALYHILIQGADALTFTARQTSPVADQTVVYAFQQIGRAAALLKGVFEEDLGEVDAELNAAFGAAARLLIKSSSDQMRRLTEIYDGAWNTSDGEVRLARIEGCGL